MEFKKENRAGLPESPGLSESSQLVESSQLGWVMVVVAAIAMVATLPGRTHGMGMITERLLLDDVLGLTRTGLGYLNLGATMLGALFCLVVGVVIDRYGLRVAVVVVMLPLGISVWLMSCSSSLLAFFATMVLVRGLGQSALSVVSISMVGKWFRAKPAFPMAAYSILLTIGFIVATLIAREYAETNWRLFWQVMGYSVFGLGLVCCVLTRDPSPRQVSAERKEGSSACQISESNLEDFTLLEAIKTPFFAISAGSISLFGLSNAGLTLFNESILADQGFGHKVYYDSLAIGAGIGIVANLVAGGLGMRFQLNRLLAVSLVFLVVALVLLTRLQTYSDVLVFVVFNATGGGMLTVLFFTVWPKLYGQTHLGSIQSAAQMLTVIASAIGPLCFAFSKDLTGDYFVVVYVLAGLFAVFAMASWFCPMPGQRLPQE